ncbi:MAG TPA: response regulator [Polyangiaceae bacterium]|jgi:CheY-like chemotaxis protein
MTQSSSATKQESSDARYRVLLVDDDAAVLRGLAAALEFDLEIVTCGSAERALELLQKSDFHAVCSDYAMPGMNGLELFERVARLPNPVVCLLLTGSTSFIGRQPTGNEYVLTKPVDPSRLSKLLVQLAHTAQLKRKTKRALHR